MKVVYAIRGGARGGAGGDAVQLQATRAALSRFGVESCVAYGESELAALAPTADIVHVFNLQTPASTLAAIRIARGANKPVALSTILWDPEALVATVAGSLAGLPPQVLLPVRGLVSRTVWAGVSMAPQVLRARMSDSLYAANMLPAARMAIRAAAILLPNSFAEQEQVVNLMPFSERKETRAKSRVVVNGVDSAELDAGHDLSRCKWHEQLSRLREQYPVVALELARCDRLKNQQGLLRALWFETSVAIILAGPMSSGSGYCERVRALANERPGVVLLESVPRDELGILLRSVDVHILPSWTETTGLSTLEAAACGCPTVATIRAPFDEYVGGISFPIDPVRPDTIRRSLHAALEAPQSRWENGARRIRREFTWERAAYETARAYDEVRTKAGTGAVLR